MYKSFLRLTLSAVVLGNLSVNAAPNESISDLFGEEEGAKTLEQNGDMSRIQLMINLETLLNKNSWIKISQPLNDLAQLDSRQLSSAIETLMGLYSSSGTLAFDHTGASNNEVLIAQQKRVLQVLGRTLYVHSQVHRSAVSKDVASSAADFLLGVLLSPSVNPQDLEIKIYAARALAEVTMASDPEFLQDRKRALRELALYLKVQGDPSLRKVEGKIEEITTEQAQEVHHETKKFRILSRDLVKEASLQADLKKKNLLLAETLEVIGLLCQDSEEIKATQERVNEYVTKVMEGTDPSVLRENSTLKEIKNIFRVRTAALRFLAQLEAVTGLSWWTAPSVFAAQRKELGLITEFDGVWKKKYERLYEDRGQLRQNADFVLVPARAIDAGTEKGLAQRYLLPEQLCGVETVETFAPIELQAAHVKVTSLNIARSLRIETAEGALPVEMTVPRGNEMTPTRVRRLTDFFGRKI